MSNTESANSGHSGAMGAANARPGGPLVTDTDVGAASTGPAGTLSGRRIVVLAGEGTERDALVTPIRALEAEGATVDVAAPDCAEFGFGGGSSERFPPNHDVAGIRAGDYEALLIPAGCAPGLRDDEVAVQLVRDFMERDKPVAVVGDGVALLVAADAVRGRTVAAGADADAVRAAGGAIEDRAITVDQKLVTARDTSDLATFADKVVTLLAQTVEETRLDRMVEQSFPASDPLPSPTSVGGSGASSETALES
jgi:protease I